MAANQGGNWCASPRLHKVRDEIVVSEVAQSRLFSFRPARQYREEGCSAGQGAEFSRGRQANLMLCFKINTCVCHSGHSESEAICFTFTICLFNTRYQ